MVLIDKTLLSRIFVALQVLQTCGINIRRANETCQIDLQPNTIDIANTSYVNHVRSVKIPSGRTYRYVFSPPFESDKPYLLFLHGFPDSSYGWINQIEYFKRHGYGVIAPDMLGYGGTDKPVALEDYRLKTVGSELMDLLDCEGLSQVVAIGHDFGSAALSILQSYYPDRLLGLSFLTLGYTPPGGDLPLAAIEAINNQTNALVGYPIFGYFPFHITEEAIAAYDNHLDSAYSVWFTNNATYQRDHLAPLDKLETWLTEDRQAPYGGTYITEATKEQWKTIVKAQGGLGRGLKWYTALLSGINQADAAGLYERRLKDSFDHSPLTEVNKAVLNSAVPDQGQRKTPPRAGVLTYEGDARTLQNGGLVCAVSCMIRQLAAHAKLRQASLNPPCSKLRLQYRQQLDQPVLYPSGPLSTRLRSPLCNEEPYCWLHQTLGMFSSSATCPAEARLSTFFDPSQPRESFADAEIEEIKLLLRRCTHYGYASVAPRTFIVLCYIGHLQVLHQLLAEEFGDSWFPIGKCSLPSFLDPRIKAAIVEHQHIIFTKSIDLEKGIHCYLDATEELPFTRINYIGSGSYGQVSRIESKVTCKNYALKTIRRRAAYGTKSRYVMREFISEMKIMKRLRHQHIVQYVGSYTDTRDLGLVMSPVADCDLAVYLKTYCTQPMFYPTLRTFYGCLASALAYLHENRIKHRDIKPHNILVYKASVLLTDFGLSHESLDTTSGTSPGTDRYKSPEVAAFGERNSTTDVWSLGCVFLEMLAALNGYDIEWLKSYYARIGTHSTNFYANVSATQQLLSYWRRAISLNYVKPVIWIETMLVTDRSTRPTAAQVVSEITASEDGTRFMYSCNACGDDFSDSDSMPVADHSSVVVENFPRTRSRPRRAADSLQHAIASGKHVPNNTRNSGYNIEHVGFLCGGALYTFCRPVPVIFGKCIEQILAIEGRQFQGSLISQPYVGSRCEERFAQLKREFDTSPDYGRSINLNRYTLFDCVSVLLDYIATIPELLGRERSKTKHCGPRLRSEKDFAVIIATLPEQKFELILVTIAFFAAYAELGGAHAKLKLTPSLNYRGWISRLAELLHVIVVRNLGPGDKLSIQTLGLVLETPLRFRSIAMTERSKRAQTLDQLPSQPLFRKKVGAPTGYRSYQDKPRDEYWSSCATKGQESEQDDDTSDRETWSSEDITIEDYDSEQFDAIDLDQVPSQVQASDTGHSFGTQKAVDPSLYEQSPRTTPKQSQNQSRLHESRLIQRRDTVVETLAITAQPTTMTRSRFVQQRQIGSKEAPELNEPYRPGLWGISVSEAVDVAGYSINSMLLTIYGSKIPYSGRVPIVVAKCIEKVICSDNEAGTTAAHYLRSMKYRRNPEHFAQLKEAFNAPPSYGIDIDWNNYTATDAIDVLFDYLKSLCEPLIPSNLSCKLPSLDSYIQRDYVPSDLASLHVYGICLAKMPESSRQLLLILIAFLASRLGCAEEFPDDNNDGLYDEVASQWGSVLSHPLDYRTATFTLLIVNAGYFLNRANGKPPTPAEWDTHIKSRASLINKNEVENIQQDEVQQRKAESMLEKDSAGAAMSSISEEQLQAPEHDSNHDGELETAKAYDYEDQRDGDEDPKHTHRPIVEDVVLEDEHRIELLPPDDDKTVLNRDMRLPERTRICETVELEDKELAHRNQTQSTAELEGTVNEVHLLSVSSPDLTPAEPETVPASSSTARIAPYRESDEVLHDESCAGNQDAPRRNESVPAPPHPQTIQDPIATSDLTGNDWQQYLEGVSSPPTPKLESRLSRPELPRLNITSVDDGVIVETPSVTFVQEGRLTPIEPPLEPNRADDAKAAENTVHRKGNHRRSVSSGRSSTNGFRPRSSAGGSVKSEKRRSRDKDEMQAVQKQRQDDKKPPKKPTGWFGRPKKGFRAWVHGIHGDDVNAQSSSSALSR
ncbi:hypothetical protein OPT61_g5809 [Boeremia exigua]|uniref:Uncharacterized protein n=1 Tax=Boeremia exigua TaxID=749465 RepID=A0ACC2I936_9PLEO|nr:hypothetical protein OPT61_g5809 [Boeremia exigua]